MGHQARNATVAIHERMDPEQAMMGASRRQDRIGASGTAIRLLGLKPTFVSPGAVSHRKLEIGADFDDAIDGLHARWKCPQPAKTGPSWQYA